MSVLACILSALAAACVYAGAAHVAAGVRRPFRAAHLTFAALALLVALHAIFHIGLYAAQNATEYLAATRAANLAGTFALALIPWLVHFYAAERTRWRPAFISGLYVLCVSLYELIPGPLARSPLQLRQVALPWGEYATVHQLAQLSGAVWLFWAVNVLCFGYVATLSVKLHQRGRRLQAIGLIASVALLMASLFGNSLVLTGRLDSLFLGEFGFVALVLVMMLSLNSDDGYRTLVAQAPAGIFLSTAAGRIIEANRSGCAMLGFTQREIRRLRIADLAAPEAPPGMRRNDALPDTPMRCEQRLRRKDGATFIADVSAQVLVDGRMLHIVRDVTEHTRVHSALRLLAESGPVGDHAAFAARCVETLVRAFDVRHALIGVLDERRATVQTLAVFGPAGGVDGFEYAKLAAPCAELGEARRSLFLRDPAQRFPQHAPFAHHKVAAYLGAAILDTQGAAIGVVEIWDETPFSASVESHRILEVFAQRIGAEIERAAADEDVRRLTSTLEARVAARTAELAQVNKQLEAFSYSVSHDLRAPVRAVSAYAQLLLESSEALDANSRSYVQRVQSAANQMSELINGLLTLATLSNQPLQSEPVDLTVLARETVSGMLEREPSRCIEFVCADSLVVLADRLTISVVLTNLLENAWKYSSHVPHARIELGSRREHGETIYYVRDNGVGFDMQHARHLFEPFRRLHSAREFPGCGIGLSTVANIVHRHGGRVWAQSAPGRGATFSFTLASPALDVADDERALSPAVSG